MSDQRIPASWQIARLEDISSDISYGYTASATTEPTGVKLLRITDIQNNTVNWSTVPNCMIDSGKIEKYRLKRRDLVFARTGATVGKSYLLKGDIPEAVYASYLIRVRCSDEIPVEFLSSYFRSPYYWRQITDFSTGIGQPNVNGTKLKNLLVSLPPLAEQKAIAEKLDTLLAQMESTKARLERIPKTLKLFRKSVLAAAVSGKLTEEWRKQNECLSISIEMDRYKMLMDKRAEKLASQPLRNDEKHLSVPDTWYWTRLASIAEIVSGVAKGSKTSKEVVEVPYLRVANVQRGYLDLHEIKNIAVPLEKAKALKLKKGDVLFNEGGDIDKLGRGWIWSGEIDGCIHQNHVFRARCYSSEVVPKFISYYGNSEGREYFIRNGTQSVNLASINKTTLSLLPVPVPPFHEQLEIVRRVDQLFAHADTIETQVNNALDRVNNLTQSILAKAFRGELTEQWRKDNPDLISGENSAEALLAKIKAERAAAKPVKRGRKGA